MTGRQQPRLFVIFGAPGSGKSTALKYLASQGAPRVRIITKEVTRERRDDDSDDVRHVRAISSDCDIRYSQYRCDYGVRTEDIWTAFKTGDSAAVIINDIRTIRLLKQRFGVLTVVVYIHSNVEPQRLREIARERHPKLAPGKIEADLQRRVAKIATIHRKYIENTALFNFTILNLYGEGYDESEQALRSQLTNLLGSAPPAQRGERSTVRIFLIVGAALSGKDELVTAMEQMEPRRIRNYQKGTDRTKRKGDRGELRHYNELPGNFDIVYHGQGFQYGVASEELWDTLASGNVSLLVVSDFPTIRLLLARLGRLCTVIYLHASFNRADMQRRLEADEASSAEIQKRLAHVDELHKLYVDKTTLFDHVLLNTAEPEDLYDQAFNVIDFYC